MKWLKRFSNNYKKAYLEELSSLKEQFRTSEHKKWSSIEEALEDFAKRNNFSRYDKSFISLMKEAGLEKEAGLSQDVESKEDLAQEMREEGLGSQAVEFMSKSKNKHTDKTWSPFALDQTNKELKEVMQSEEKVRHDQFEQSDTEKNEFSRSARKEYLLNKLAQEFGKILDLDQPSLEKVEELSKELERRELKKEYKIVRYGFQFSGFGTKGKLKVQNEPIKVTVHSYGFLKDTLADRLNDQVRKQLSQELPIEKWIAFLKEQGQQIPQSGNLINKLIQLYNQIYGEKAVYVQQEKGKTKPEQVNLFMRTLPKSYQLAVLKMLIEGQYRHWVKEEIGKGHSERISSSHQLGTFMLMEDYNPFIRVVPEPKSNEEKMQLAKGLFSLGKTKLSSEEFISLLEQLGISHIEKPSHKEFQTLKVKKDANPIEIENKINEGYRPLTNKLSREELQDPDLFADQMIKFQDHIAGVLLNDIQKIQEAEQKGISPELTPLAYESTEEGIKPVDILNMQRKDYTTEKFKDQSNEQSFETGGLFPHKEFSKFTPSQREEGIKMPDIKLEDLDALFSSPEKEEKKEKKSDDDIFAEFFRDASNKIELLKRAQQSDIWISDDGILFNSQQEMENHYWQEFLQEAKDDVIDLAASELQREIEQIPEPKEEKVAPPAPEEKVVPNNEKQLAANKK